MDLERKPLLNELYKIPKVKAVMMIDERRGLLEHISNSLFEKEHPTSELRYVAKLIALRYKIADFHKILDGLELTVNMFRNDIMITTSLDDVLLTLILDREINMNKAINALKSALLTLEISSL
jgi:hypothetical protein